MMIPITRKEKYINEIVGGGDTAPKTPQTREEFFFADILGEVIAPSPVTRVEKYLSAIAGQYSGDLPTPITRIEYFLARAAGMEIETPIPITREEMLWDTYIPIKTIEGIPPLTFKAKKAGTLKDYRIYGNTEIKTRSYSGAAPLSFPITDGTVSNYRVYGQTSRNLFDFNTAISGYRIIWATGELDVSDDSAIISDFIPVKENNYQINISAFVACYNSEKIYLGIYYSDGYIKNYSSAVKSFTIDNNCKYIKIFTFSNSSTPVSLSQDTMLNSGSALLPYEPYGESVGNLVTDSQSEHYGEYAIPITNNSETANIYLDTPLRKVGDEAEYVDYAEQKRYNADGTSEDVTLPALPAQSSINSLSVGTEVQPSSVAVDVGEIVSCGDKVTDSQSVNYGKYKIPVTLTAGSAETTDIYLDEPLRMVGDEAEYVDYAEQKQHRVRKNLLQNTAISQTANGVTFTVNNDGGVTCNGTATNIIEVRVFTNFLLPPGNYRLTGCPPGGWSSYPGGKVSYCLRAWYTISGNITWLFDYGDGCNFTLTDTTKMLSSIVIEKAQVVDNITFYPMIRKADIEDDTYEPYIENTELDVTLPALPTLTGTNVLSVGTAVQPSKVYIKYKGERQ